MGGHKGSDVWPGGKPPTPHILSKTEPIHIYQTSKYIALLLKKMGIKHTPGTAEKEEEMGRCVG